MIITRHGDYFLKFVFADKIIGLNPISKDSKLKTTKFGSDVVLSNVFHKDFNGFDFMSFGDREPFIIKGPGEYEIADVFIKAFGFVSKFDGEDRVVTSYTMLLDGINVGIFGPITSGDQFSNDAFEEFSKSDVFILPIGGGDTFSPKDA
ncbi:Zn-dependent hydrolase of the metallo-beta-lactamase superfamily [sediment metagenome]|uniref:Zn-dependent hydrolase of the metallo-beta-lactamase superfamily n=1 Tax=sediment metagenome TaxID=749907 RepID=D9PF18_9ZZZZ